MKKHIILFIVIVLLVSGLALIAYGGVAGSKHDLSAAGSPVPACMFCHAPHNARTDSGPLWNLVDRGITYQMYSSDTMSNPSPLAPSGISLACLSCHDGAGTIGDGQHHIDIINKPGYLDNPAITNCEKCHPGSRPDSTGMYSDILLNSIGKDLRNDHPISIPYPTPAQDPDFFVPPDSQKGWSDVPLFNGKVECGSCHDPHNPTNTPFLRKSNAGSALCTTCHNK